jgi:hypothetical protein
VRISYPRHLFFAHFSLAISMCAQRRKIRGLITQASHQPYITPRRTCRGDASTRFTLHARLICCWSHQGVHPACCPRGSSNDTESRCPCRVFLHRYGHGCAPSSQRAISTTADISSSLASRGLSWAPFCQDLWHSGRVQHQKDLVIKSSCSDSEITN